MLDFLLIFAALNAVLAIPMMLLWRRDFARLGRVSPSSAVFSGIVMHGHGLLAFAIAWVDRGALAPTSPLSTYTGGVILIIGALIIFSGRYAYGSVARVYGLKEDMLIERGIYRWTRNPQYFGYWMMFIGAAIMSLSGWAFILAAAFAIIIHVHVTRVEEPHLRKVFSDEYKIYCTRVARYFGPASA